MTTKQTPAIMVQGTSSNAGKTYLAMALCRILADDGFTVMPFKAQNMTSQAHIFPDGTTMSGSQVLQAIAARQNPDARMNPVLLRPTSHTGSEVVLLGKSQGHMGIGEYTEYKEHTAFPAVQRAYDSLAAQADVMVLEGAGSPAEINLKSHDIVNMRMATYAKAAVVLTGDIDRGGVFAHLYGTYILSPKEEQDCIAGFILNKFRGDPSLLQPALDEITALTGKPFLGVIPHAEGIELPQEDSLAIAEHGSAGLTLDAPELDAAISAFAAIVRNALDLPLLYSLAGIAKR